MRQMMQMLQTVTASMATMNAKVDAMNGKIDAMKEEQRAMKEEQRAMKEEQGAKIGAMQEEQHAMKKEIDNLDKDITTFVSPLYSIQAVSEEVVTQLTDGTFNETAREHYVGTSSCVILGQLFSSTRQPETYRRRFFRAVAEHIVPKAQWTVAVNWGFRNALFLLKHLELKYRAGHLSLIPDQVQDGEDRVRLVVEISDALMGTFIQYKGHRDGDFYGEPVWGAANGAGKLKQLAFGDLHRKSISVHPRPYMRALFLKADMAHRQHAELTSPFSIQDRYTTYCPQMRHGLIQRLPKFSPTDLRLQADEYAEHAGSP